MTIIFVGKVESKSQSNKIFQYQNLSKYLRKGHSFLHVNLTFIDFKMTVNNMGSWEPLLLISGDWALSAPLPLLVEIQSHY